MTLTDSQIRMVKETVQNILDSHATDSTVKLDLYQISTFLNIPVNEVFDTVTDLCSQGAFVLVASDDRYKHIVLKRTFSKAFIHYVIRNLALGYSLIAEYGQESPKDFSFKFKDFVDDLTKRGNEGLLPAHAIAIIELLQKNDLLLIYRAEGVLNGGVYQVSLNTIKQHTLSTANSQALLNGTLKNRFLEKEVLGILCDELYGRFSFLVLDYFQRFKFDVDLNVLAKMLGVTVERLSEVLMRLGNQQKIDLHEQVITKQGVAAAVLTVLKVPEEWATKHATNNVSTEAQ